MTIDNSILENPIFERQLELEQEMRTSGIQRFRKSVEKASDKGQMTGTLAVNRLVSEAHEKVVAAIAGFLAEAKSGAAGRRHTAVAFIDKLDVDTVANITARVILDEVTRKSNLTKTSLAIGSMLENEFNSRKFEEEMPKAYKKFLKKAQKESLDRRKWSHLLYPARLLGVELEEWSEKDRILVGLKLVDIFIQSTGLIEREVVQSARFGTLELLTANEATMRWMETENSRLEHLFPIYMPTIVPPKPWTSPFDGGYYTAFRRLKLVKTHNQQYLEELANRDLSEVYEAINALQDTAWAINTQVLDVVRTLYETGAGVAGLPQADKLRMPARPHWLPEGKEKMAVEDMTKEQVEEFKAWKAETHRTHVENAAISGRRASFLRTLGVAEKFKDEEAFFYPHTLDWRGRAYPLPLYLTPQGNDLQRGLLTFSNAVPIHDQEAAEWLAIHGAGCWGYDKVDMEERVQWVLRNEEQIIASAENPYDNRFWMDADKGEKKWQFLAFCFEWAGLKREGYGYMSCLPIQMDGTCNGLQNFSAMLLDEVGGAAVNLIPADEPQDIYQKVCDIVCEQLARDLNSAEMVMIKGKTDSGEEYEKVVCTVAEMASGWLPKMGRKVTKRPVMTLAYGARRFGFVSQVDEDTIKDWRTKEPEGYPFVSQGDDGKAIDFGYKAAQYMGGLIWDSVGEVVVKAREAMDWLQAASQVASKEGLPINWSTPVGFLVQQAYRVPNMKRVDTTFNSQRLQIRYQHGVGKIDSRRQASGISPNWVHSLDASHLMKTIGRSKREGINSFSMIHDSYGTHAGNAWALARYLREEFVQLYSQVDVLERFKAELEAQTGEQLPDLPAKGKLDLEQVLESPFFFA
ncbi:DNA-directed RNA polymerase [Rhizobium leguminosarum]|uniref:DNA-directed RNA polymerase n=1 Tax=Rhizobium leguminosarum TaxID=384 RepID=UPI00161FADE3|nr:DNA-directed RNA polymerase [Rhizobium leguminosarum]MBB4345243.1 DNA-directed RNA polymerase [Rhizobium leguminosarum]MBB6298314.1 DNA-directed RNA polymerase [Rhizobium leguminosarum]